MLYELRVYHMNPGKTKACSDRFEQHTLALFARHGIRVEDFWLDAAGGERLYYLCSFADEAAKDAAWAAFRADPDWAAAKAKTEAEGALVEHVDAYTMRRAPFFSK